ncbi:Cyk3p Ecym_3366 [Eremothecium cymbalariae DBVPG|uniref:SH3 domain-containing protein n=1 Tax=Eremothecium cymbalariae (strain CBS 270.75 / DBVPG 7215 / KCTC 17166 / NRRL Y-17582) TaxID=931890 RepID=G8JRT4_ERECY|nr:Hypothetical protein Ecym_3366 [Eremothecium cymbalariae DBVPG\
MSGPLPNTPFKVRALYSWSGEQGQDLGFLESDLIEVTKVKGDWLYGRLLRNKKTGYFPLGYVQLIQEVYNSFNSLSPKKPYDTGSTPTTSPSKLQNAKSTLPPIPRRSSAIENDHEDIYSTMSRDGTSPLSFPGELSPSSRRIQHYEKGFRTPPRMSPYHYGSSSNISPISNDNSIKPFPHRYGGRFFGIDSNGSSESVNKLNMQNKGDYTRERSKSDLPPLPPIPDTTSSNTNVGKSPQSPLFYAGGTASHSCNELYSRDSSARRSPMEDSNLTANYFNSNHNFYDGYAPSSFGELGSAHIFANTRYMEESLTASEESFAMMSDFSASSAGSLARHRFAQSFTDSMNNSNDPLEDNASQPREFGVPNKMTEILRKVLGTGTSNSTGMPKLPDLSNLNISDGDASTWLQAQAHLHRSNTLSSKEKRERERRVLCENRDVVLRPQEYINEEINTNDVLHGQKPGVVDIELKCLDVERIDLKTRKRCQQTGPFTVESFADYNFRSGYKTQIEQLRGLYTFCTEFFRLIDDRGKTNFEQEPKDIDGALHHNYCTPYQLTWIFKRMANTLGIQCDLIVGFLKTPNADNLTFKLNHCWLRVLVNGEMRLIDVILGNISNPIHEYVNNRKQIHAEDFYFLAQPLHLIYTHVPQYYDEQHIIPAIDRSIALCLPLVFPTFFKNDLRIYKFSLGLCELQNSEIFECSIKLPFDIDIHTSVITNGRNGDKFRNMNLSLVQFRLHKRNRVAVIKAVLPPGVSSGILHIHSGITVTCSNITELSPLSMMIPLTHVGTSKEYEFVARISSSDSQKVDVYIKEPQNKFLFTGNEYTFQIIQTPCDGLVYDSYSHVSKPLKVIMLQAPSGKVYKLRKSDPNQEFGTWEHITKINEPGIWVGLVTSDSGSGWCPFAKWTCI